MPGNASVVETSGQPQVNTLADFSCGIVGYSTTSAAGVGKVSPGYSKPGAAAADMGIGDMVDVATQALSPVYGATNLPPVVCVSTPATTPGSYGTIDIAGVKGTSVPANDTSIAPKGTYQPRFQIVNGGTVGTTGVTVLVRLGRGGPDKLVSLGTATSYDFPASDGWPAGSPCGVVFAPSASAVSALYTKLNSLRTEALAHFLITSGSPAIHLAQDTTDNTALTAIAAATTPATAVTLFNAIKSLLGAHGASTTYHTAADTALATALAAIPTAANVADVDLHLPALIAAYSAHIALVGSGPVHGSADGTDTITAYTAAPGTLLAGDIIQTTTLPPQWTVGDLYTAQSGPTDASGALVELAKSPQLVGRVVITEPVASGDVSTLIAALDYALGLGRRWRLICRFRDPNAGESDATYIAAFQAFLAAATYDSRICYLAGSGLQTDTLSGRTYLRTFMAAYIARLQSMPSFPGQKGERLAQNAGWVARGPLPDFTLRDADGNTVGHDEAQRAGIGVAPGSARGGGISVYYQTNPNRLGTYIDNNATVAYPVDSEILTPQDRDLANALESLAVAISLDVIGGADIIGDGSPRTMDEDVGQALAGRIQKAAENNYGKEFANADDPNLVSIDDTVVVTGPAVDITGEFDAKFYANTNNVTLRFAVSR